MKLSKQEKIATIIILLIVMIGVGIFVFIKPALETLGATQDNLENKKAEWQTAEDKRSKKGPLKDKIIEAYNAGEHMADMFFPELTSYQSDMAFKAFLTQSKANVIVEEVDVAEPATSVLTPYISAVNEVKYDLKTYASQGAEPKAEDVAREARIEKMKNFLGPAQTIGASTVSFTVRAIDREELLKFADEINSYILKENGVNTRKAIMLNGLAFKCPEVTKKYEQLAQDIIAEATKAGMEALEKETGLKAGERNDEDKLVQGSENLNPDEEEDDKNIADINEYVYLMETSVTFYSVQRMTDPQKQLDAQDGITA